MNLSAEWQLYVKLKSLDSHTNTFDGVTSWEQRRENMRQIIRKIGPEVLYTIRDGKHISLAKQFEKVYEVEWS